MSICPKNKSSKARRDKVGIAGMFKNFGKNKEEK